MVVRIVTAYSNLGGSTVAHINLTNLFNSKGLDTILYGPQDWHLDKCKSDKVSDAILFPDDHLIIHCTNLPEKPKCKKIILSCHETNVFPVSSVPNPVWDGIHFVSQSQKDWQGVEGTVIPNVVSKIKPHKYKTFVAGVIGSIFEHKQTELSIKRARKDGYLVKIFGFIEDPNYFFQKVFPLLNENVMYCGVVDDKQKIYDEVDIVYHSSQRETFNFIKAECKVAGVAYNGLDSADPNSEYWEDDKIFEAWKDLLEL